MIARRTSRMLCVVAFVVGGSPLLSCEFLAGESMLPDTRPTPTTRQEVWRTVVAELRERGASEQHLPRVEDIDLPVVLSLDGRKLRVVSSCWDDGPRRTQFRLECGASGQCLPFLVYVHDATSSDTGVRAQSCRLAVSHPVPEVLLKPAVRAGERATAVFRSDGLRMTASVTCLERGREGGVIRVRAADGHVFRARISGPDLLEALPQ